MYLLNGLYDAKSDIVPVLAITGHTYHDLIGTYYQQDTNVPALYADVALYNSKLRTCSMSLLLLTWLAGWLWPNEVSRTSIFRLIVQEAALKDDDPPMMKTQEHTSAVWMKVVLAPSSDEIKRAASVLNKGSKTAIVCGQGALDCGELIEEIAEKLAAPVMKAFPGRAVVPDDSPFTTGGIGLLSTLPSELAMEEYDSLLIIGSNMPYVNYYPKAGQARAVQIDSDPSHLGWRYEIEVGLVGDARATLEALLPLIKRKNDHLLCQ